MAKPNADANKKGVAKPVVTDGKKATDPPRKVITFSTIENFEFQTWRDFSDLRLIEPSHQYPIIEIEIVLNFFPGDHFTAEKYKSFVTKITKQHQAKDQRITIDDYFHVEDHREWTFFVGNHEYITPWWMKDPTRFILSCIFLIGWPFRMSYKGRIAKHHVEVKKAVFVENTQQDEGVSLTATPNSSNNEPQTQQNPTAPSNSSSVANVVPSDEKKGSNPGDDDADFNHHQTKQTSKSSSLVETTLTGNSAVTSAVNPGLPHSTAPPTELRHNEHVVDAVISDPPPDYTQYSAAAAAAAAVAAQQQQHRQRQVSTNYTGPSLPSTIGAGYSGIAATGAQPTAVVGMQINATQNRHPGHSVLTHHPLAHVLPSTPPMPPQRSMPLSSPRTHLRETTKDIVTAVTHQDINGVSAVNTVTLKDIDVQMTALSGYETYV